MGSNDLSGGKQQRREVPRDERERTWYDLTGQPGGGGGSAALHQLTGQAMVLGREVQAKSHQQPPPSQKTSRRTLLKARGSPTKGGAPRREGGKEKEKKVPNNYLKGRIAWVKKKKKGHRQYTGFEAGET